jgi:5-methylcytosine-specific restriction endonuclease McrA
MHHITIRRFCSHLQFRVFVANTKLEEKVDSFDDSEENLRALCVSCHKQKTAMENQI